MLENNGGTITAIMPSASLGLDINATLDAILDADELPQQLSKIVQGIEMAFRESKFEEASQLISKYNAIAERPSGRIRALEARLKRLSK